MKKIITILLIISSSFLIAQDYGSWFSATPLNLDRADHASLALPDGSILVAGGQSQTANNITNTCEKYDYSINSWSYVADMNKPRSNHNLVLLDSNRVLAIGGYREKSCEIYFIKENSWVLTDSLNVMRLSGLTASLLKNGNVLVAGGFAVSDDLKTLNYLNNAEIYDKVLGRWREVDSLKIGRAYHTATLLKNGKLFIVGGETTGIELNECELFDSVTEQWSVADTLNVARYNHSQILLPNGTVLVSGGSNYTNSTSPWLNSCEIYEPDFNTWSLVQPLHYTRNTHSSLLLNNGLILFTGGSKGDDTWELYDPNVFENIYSDNFPIVQMLQRIEKLPNGNVISIGGITWRDSTLPVITTTAMCEIYSSVTDVNTELNNKEFTFNLSQNYPNPFNPITLINYDLYRSSNVKLVVYNILGVVVKKLVDSFQTSGSYSVKFDGNDLPSGIYFYRLSAKDYKITKKMVLLK
jgi:N-acetylneuraminic acid mutarotase